MSFSRPGQLNEKNLLEVFFIPVVIWYEKTLQIEERGECEQDQVRGIVGSSGDTGSVALRVFEQLEQLELIEQ